MQRKTNFTGTEPIEPSPLIAASDAVDREGQAQHSTGAGRRFLRHLAEMVIAMLAGMAVLEMALAVLGEPPGYDSNLLVRYGLMGAFMAVPMVMWMRYRGHSWTDGREMTAAMLLPMFALVLPVELSLAVPGLHEHSLMMLAHVVMIGGMVSLMIYRWDRYAHGGHVHHSA